MQLACTHLSIDDVMVLQPQRFGDSRGYFVETYNANALAGHGIRAAFVQDNEALSEKRGTLRGLHFQLAPSPQLKLVRAVTGAIFDVAVDLREGSETYGKWCGATLTSDGGEQILVPVGFAHAYVTLEPNTLVAYKVDGFYDKAAEGGVRWDDPEIGIDWPIAREDIFVSDKDKTLPRLRDLRQPLRFS